MMYVDVSHSVRSKRESSKRGFVNVHSHSIIRRSHDDTHVWRTGGKTEWYSNIVEPGVIEPGVADLSLPMRLNCLLAYNITCVVV
jgi:hypothetical protein